MSILTCDDQATARQYFGKYAAIVVAHDADASAAGLTDDGRKRGEICVDVPGILEEPADPPPPPAAGNGHAPPEEPTPRALRVVAKPSFMPGFFFIPEPGENVWVEFVAGDIDFPIWTGMWYPTNKSPATVSGTRPTKDQKVIRTVSGHVVQLEDTDGQEKILITHTIGSFISIDQDGVVVIGNQKGSTVVLDAKAETLVIVDQHKNSVRMTTDGVGVVNKDGSATIYLTADMARVTAKDIVLEGSSVSLGKGAGDPTILADATFQSLWNAFAAHTHATGVGPSGPPVPLPPMLMPGSGLTSAVMVK